MKSSTHYTLRNVRDLLGLSRSIIAGLIASGFVTPALGPRNQHVFTFHDLMILRTAHALQQARIPPRRIVRALMQLRKDLPASAPLTALRVAAIGSEVAVRDPQTGGWLSGTGQGLFDFEDLASRGSVSRLASRSAAANRAALVAEHGRLLALAEDLEATDPQMSEEAYRRAIALRPGDEAAYLNLGALMCESARCKDAIALYAAATETCPPSAALFYNQAVALEDGEKISAAISAYHRCLELDPSYVDAHYNLARLHEKLGERQAMLRHLSAYRRARTPA